MMPDPINELEFPEPLAQVGGYSAERCKRKCRHDNDKLTRRRNASGKQHLAVTKSVTKERNGKP